MEAESEPGEQKQVETKVSRRAGFPTFLVLVVRFTPLALSPEHRGGHSISWVGDNRGSRETSSRAGGGLHEER